MTRSDLPNLNQLTDAVIFYNQNYARSDMNIQLDAKIFDLEKDYNNLNQFENEIGVYILLNHSHEILRIGSSIRCLYSRLNQYFDYSDEECIVGIGWTKEGIDSRYIRIIYPSKDKVYDPSKNQAFEVLAIEKYLLDELLPPLNSEGKNRHKEFRKELVDKINDIDKLYGRDTVNKL